MAKSDTNKPTTASVLAFERKLDPSDAIFSAGKWEDRENGRKWPALAVREKSVRGTISNRLKTKDQDPAKLDASIQSPNLQTVDVTTLPHDKDTLRVSFTIRILSDVGVPSACNNADYQAKLSKVVKSYTDEYSFGEVAFRYACNIANGRFLWRNRLGAEQIVIHARRLTEGETTDQMEFKAFDYDLRSFSKKDDQQLNKLAAILKDGFTGTSYVILEVVAFARMGEGQEVYPSQELILDKGSAKGGKSKTLYSVNGVAAMHSQKIGNALRTIDTWYPNPDNEDIGPIAVEPYGSVTSQGRAYRQPKQKSDFYTLFDNWVLNDQIPQVNQQHYVMANLVRGGVFGDGGKE